MADPNDTRISVLLPHLGWMEYRDEDAMRLHIQQLQRRKDQALAEAERLGDQIEEVVRALARGTSRG